MTSSGEPLVSAIITTHNRADLLSRALNSVIAQTYPDIEIIVVNDGSTDSTEEVIKKYLEKYELVYLEHEMAKGAPAARNYGIRQARGKFVAGLDDDDAWHPDRIKRMFEVFNENWAYISSDCYYVTSRRKGILRRKAVITYEDMLYRNAAGNQIFTLRDRVLEVGGFDEELKAAQDYDLYLRLNETFGPARNIQEPLQTIYINRGKDDRISHNAFRGYLQFYKKHKQRLNRKQRQFQLYKIRQAQDKNNSLSKIIKHCPSRFLPREVLEFTKKKLRYK